MSFLEKCLFRSFTHFLNLIMCFPGVESYKFFIYFEIKHLIDVSLANMSSHRAISLFIFDDSFFSYAEAFKFDIVPIVYFSFIMFSLVDISAKILICEIS